MLNNFIYAKQKSLFEKALNNGEVLDEAIVFIEDTKEIWNHGTYFDGSKVDLSNIEASIQSILANYATKTELNKKQDAISDLATIRANAAKGATALQSVPSEYVTETELSGKGYATTSALNSGLSGKVDKDGNKVLSTNDFTDTLKNRLMSLSNYDDSAISNAINKLRTDFNTLVSGDTTTAIKTFNEVIAFLDGITDTQDLEGIIASIEQQIATKQDKISDLETIRQGAAKGATALQSYTEKYTGTYSKPSGGIPKDDLASAVKTSLGKADTALQSIPSEYITETELAAKGYTTNIGTVTGVKMNGSTKNPSNGVVDLGTIITAHQDISGKLDKTTAANTYATKAELSSKYAFAKVSDGTTTITADTTDDTLTVAAGSGASIALDSTNDKLIISHSDTSTLSGAYGPTANVTGSNNATIVVPQITVDGFGHVTGVTNRTYTSKDTDTKVTSVGNHYTPEANDDAALNAASGSLTNITGTSGKLNVVTGLQRDAKGHIVGVTSANIYSTDNNTTQFTITATATDDDVVVLTGTNGTNKVTFDAKHAKKGPSSGYTSGNTTTSISGSGGSGTIKVPQITVDAYGHVTAAADESVTITMPSVPVTSVAGKTGAVTLAKGDVGLGNVTNESKATMFTNAALTGNPTAPTQSAGNNSTRIATTAFVQTEIANKIAAADAMIYKGTIGSSGATVAVLPSTTAKTGWTYKVATAGTYDSKACEVGDMIICLTDGSSSTAATWTVVQNNIDGAVTGPASSTDARVAVFNGTTGKVIKDSGFTIGKSVPSNAVFTDTNTHYTSKNIVGASSTATANATASNGGVYLNHLEESTVKSTHLIKGTGATTVTSDSNGNITISSTDTNTWRPLGTTADTACAGNDSRLSNARPASDVYSWAKAASKPPYSWSEITGKPSTFTPSSHNHSNIKSRGSVTCETGVAGRPAVEGLSMTQAYNNGYPTPYGNVISLRGMGDGQILVGWSGSDGAHAPVYVRSKRDNTTTAKWSDWAQVYTSANPPTSVSGSSGSCTGNAASASSVAWSGVTGKPTFATVATSGSYNDLSNKPTIPTNTNQLTNGSGFITGITKAMVTTALGYTPPTSDTDTKNTAGSTNDTSKLYIIGAKSQANNPQTFSNSGVYTQSGSLYATHFYETSDKRFKTNIEPILSSDNCPVVRQFDWKVDGSRSYGFIAQELEEQGYKELVDTDEEGKKTVNYSAALSLTVGKLYAKIIELENEIKELKNVNNSN